KAAAADAAVQLVAQALQPPDPGVQVAPPLPRQALPVGPGRDPVLRQGRQGLADLCQRHPGALRHLDQRHPPQHRARVAALVAGVAGAADQAARLVEMQRRHGDAAARGNLAHAQPVAAARLRGMGSPAHRLTSIKVEVLACHTPDDAMLPMHEQTLRLALLYGIDRALRFRDTVASWTLQRVQELGGWETERLDPATPAVRHGPARVRNNRTADAFQAVRTEYCHGFPAAMKPMIDAVY